LKPAPFSYRTRAVPDTAARLAGQSRSAMFMDYRMPAAARMPPIDVLIAQGSPAAGHPPRGRGSGGGAVSAAGAVLARVVRDAWRLAGSVGRLPHTRARVGELATNGGGR
jgi:CO/xanthine dehydrogenase Mo-binding subunit